MCIFYVDDVDYGLEDKKSRNVGVDADDQHYTILGASRCTAWHVSGCASVTV